MTFHVPARIPEPMNDERLSKWLEGPMTAAAREALHMDVDFSQDRERWRTPEMLEGVKRYERAAIIDRTVEKSHVADG